MRNALTAPSALVSDHGARARALVFALSGSEWFLQAAAVDSAELGEKLTELLQEQTRRGWSEVILLGVETVSAWGPEAWGGGSLPCLERQI